MQAATAAVRRIPGPLSLTCKAATGGRGMESLPMGPGRGRCIQPSGCRAGAARIRLGNPVGRSLPIAQYWVGQ